MDKNICKNLNCKYSQKLLDHAKHSATDAYRTASKRAIQNTKVSRTSSLNSLETVTNKAENIRLDREIPIELYKFSEKRQKMVVDLRLI